MWLTLDELRCSACNAFVHPLLDACPSCGTARASRRLEAASGPIGAVRLVEAPEIERIAYHITVRYTMKVNSLGGGSFDPNPVSAVALLAAALTYRMTGDAVPTTENASLSLRDGAVLAQVRPSGALLAEVPLPSIAGAAAGHGEITLYYAQPPGTRVARALAAGGPAGLLQLTAANRRGLLASRARDDHYWNLARLLGPLAAAAAERRWTEIGLPAYLVELGLAAGDPAGGRTTGSVDEATPTAERPAAGSPSSIESSLVELEQLRAAGLLADGEYAEKRREILARL
jgi:hypothetical protein